MISFRIRRLVPVAIPLLAGAIFALDRLMPLGVADWVLYYIPLLLSFYAGGRFSPISLAGVFSVLTVIGFYLSPPGMNPGLAAVNLSLGIATLMVVAILLTKLRQSADETRKLSRAVEQSPASICITDLSGRITYINPKFTEVTGYTLKEAAGKNPRILKSGETPPEEYAKLWETITASREWRGLFHNRKKTGELYWSLASIAPVLDDAGKPTHFLAVSEDVTEQKRVEEALLERDEQLRLYAEYSPAAVAMLDRDMKYLVVSKRWIEAYKLENQPVIGRSHYEVLPEVPQRWIDVHQRCLAGAVEKCEEDLFVRADGTTKWVRWEVRPWRRADGSVGGVLIFSENITARKQAEEALQQSEMRLRMVTENSRVGLVMVNRERRYTFANKPYAEILGLPSPDIVGQRVADVLAPLYEDQIRPRLDRAFGGERVSYELQRTDRGGDRFYAVGYEPTTVGDSVPLVVVVITEITEHKRVQEELTWKTAFLEAQVNSALDGILVVDAQGKKILQNQRLIEMFRVPAEIADDRDDSKLLRHVAAMMKNAARFLERVAQLNAHPDEIGRDEIELANGTILDRYSSPVQDRSGKNYGRIWTFRDITERRELEAQFLQAQKMEGIGQLAGGVAHDFNNILAVIQMQSDLLKSSETLSVEQAKLADEISVTVHRAAALTRQLLLFSRREEFKPADLDLSQSIANTVKMLQRILGDTVEIHLKPAPQPMLVHADPGMMDQVLLNLAVNARDAMPNGGRVVIETSAREFDEFAAAQSAEARPGSFVCLTVSDSGCGIPPAILPRIFEPFFTTKDVGKGTGLGLATVFGIVQQHQGWINVYSEVGRGTTFRIYLPRLAKTEGVTSTDTTLTTMTGGSETILLVEDDPTLRASLRKILSQVGYRIVEAPTGVHALKGWEENRETIRLLLTDLVMPEGMSGRDLAQHLLQNDPKLKVIYMSGYSAEIAGKDFPLKEGENFLTKPFRASKLVRTIRATLDSNA